MGCSEYKGKIVETDKNNASEFIIIPYEEEIIDTNKYNQIKNELNINSQILFNKIENISLDFTNKSFLEINDIYVDSCIRKELFSYLIFKIYYNKLNLTDNNEFNLEANNLNKINIILDCIDKNIINLQTHNNISYLNDKKIKNYMEIINSIFTIEDDLNLTLRNLFYLFSINNIETEINQSNSKFSMEYFNKYNGELFCIGNDYTNKNNLSISITKKNWLNDGPLHYFDTDKKVIDVCIFSKIRNEKFIKVENQSNSTSINYNIEIIDVTLDTSIDTVDKQANNIYKHKHLILKLGYLNNGSYFIDSINNNADAVIDNSITFTNSKTHFKLQKISNKKYEFYIYIIERDGSKLYLNDNGDTTTQPNTIWYIMPPGYVKDYYEASIETPTEFGNYKYYIKLTSGPSPTHTGYLAAQNVLPNDDRSGGAYVMVHKNKNEASEWEIIKESDDTFKIKCVGGKNAVINQWLASHKYNSRDKRDYDSSGLLSVFMMTHPGDVDGAIFKIENKQLKVIGGHPTVNYNGYVTCHDWYRKDRRDDKSVYLMCWRGSTKNIFKFEKVDNTVDVEETNDILVDKHYLNIKTYNSNNISISLENIINDNILPNNINFRFIYRRPYIKIFVDNGINSKYLDKNGKLVDSDDTLSNHYLEIPYYNNPYVVIGSSNFNYDNNDIFKKNEHLVYIKNETINKYLNVLKHNKSNKTPISFKTQTETENNSNIEFDKYTDKHLDFLNISQESSIQNPTLEECKAEALKNNNYNYIRYVTSESPPPSYWISIKSDDAEYDWYRTKGKKFSSLTEARHIGHHECAKVHMGVMGSGQDFNNNNGHNCNYGWYSDKYGLLNNDGCGSWPLGWSGSSHKWGDIICKVPKQRKSNCTLLKECDNFNNDARYTVYKKNPDADDGFDEGISGWCSSSKINTQNTTENLYPDEFLWRLVYTGSSNKFKLINTEAPNIIIDNIDLIKIDDKNYLFKKGSMYLSESNNVANFITSEKEQAHKMNIIPYKKIISNSFLNSRFKLNRQITNFKFTNSRITNETTFEPIDEKQIDLSLNRIFIFNININDTDPEQSIDSVEASQQVNTSMLQIIDQRVIKIKIKDTIGIFGGYLSSNNNDSRDGSSRYTHVHKNINYAASFKIHKLSNRPGFKLECIDGEIGDDDGNNFTGWLGAHDWFNAQRGKNDDDVRERKDNSQTSFTENYSSGDNTKSIYMMIHNDEDTASIFDIEDGNRIKVIGGNLATQKGYISCRTDNIKDKRNNDSYYLICHIEKNNGGLFEFIDVSTQSGGALNYFNKIKGGTISNNNILQTESYDGTVQKLTWEGNALSLYFNNINVNKKYNIFMSKKGINEYDLIGRYHLTDLTSPKYPINTNINKASFAGSWSCGGTGCSGNLYVRDIDYHYDNITKNATNLANYYDFKLIEEKILFSITEDNSGNDKIFLEKIIVSISNNNLLVYSYLELVDTTMRHSTAFINKTYFYYKLHINKKLENDVRNITLKLVPKNDGYSLLVMTNNKNTNIEGTKMLDIIENINLHSLFTGTINNYNVPNFNIKFKHLQYNNPRSSNIIKNGYNYRIKHKKSGKYLSLIRNKLTLDNNHRRQFKFKFLKVLHTEHASYNDNSYFHYEKNKTDFLRKFNEEFFSERINNSDTANKDVFQNNITVYNYTAKTGPFEIVLMANPNTKNYFVKKNPMEKVYKALDLYDNTFKFYKTGHGRLADENKNNRPWKFNTNDILIYEYDRNTNNLQEKIEKNKEYIDYELKNYIDSSKTETCLVSEDDLKVNKNKIIVLDTDYRNKGAGEEFEGGYFNFYATPEQQTIFYKKEGQDLYIYNPRHNNYYKIHVKLNKFEEKFMNDSKYSSNIQENKKFNAHGQLKIKITPDTFRTINVGPYEGTKVIELDPEYSEVTEVDPIPINLYAYKDNWLDRFNLEIVNNNGKRQLRIQRNDTETKSIKCLYDPGDHRGWGMDLRLNGIVPGQEKNLLEASEQEKQYENISFDKFFEKDDVLIYYYEKDDSDSFTNINRLIEYVESNCMPNSSDINNKWSIIEENGKYKFYNDYFNTYLGENNIANYDNGVDFTRLQRGYKEKINNTEFTLEKTGDSSHYGIKNIENNRRIYGLWNGDESFNFHLKDSLYKSMITYFRSHLSDNASFEFIQETVNYEHEKTSYITKRNIYNNNIYLPKIHHRYRIRNKLFNEYLGIDSTNNTAKMYNVGKINNFSNCSFDVIYINNNYIFYNAETKKFLGENNINIKLSIKPSYIKEMRQEEKLDLNNLTITKIYFKLENSFINNCFYMKNIETNKYIVRTNGSVNKLLYYRFENLDPHFMYEFELIDETPFNTQQEIRNKLKGKLPLTDY